MELRHLTKTQNNFMAIIKGGTVLSLLTLLPQLDSESAHIIKSKRFTLQFIVPNGESMFLSVKKGKILLNKGFAFLPTLTLLFPKTSDFNKLFLSAGGTVIPLPGSVKFISALKIFKALMGRVQFFLGKESDNQKTSLILLLNAALEGVCRVAENDNYVEKRIERIPDGIIEVSIENTDICLFVQKKGFYFQKTSETPNSKPNARLVFKDMETAFGVFTGKLSATVALGMTDISIRGKLSMIQGLFPLLDRFSFYMAISKDTK